MYSAHAAPTWWAPTPHGLPLRAKIGTSAVALCFLLVTVLVWISPSASPSDGDTPDRLAMTAEDQLRAEVATLRDRLADETSARTPDEPVLLPPPAQEEDDEPEQEDEDDQGDEPKAAPRDQVPTGPERRESRGREAPVPESDGPANPRNPTLPEPDRAPAPKSTPRQQNPAKSKEPQDEKPRKQQEGAGSSDSPSPEPEPITAPSKAELLDPELRYYGMYTVQSPFNWATLDDVATRTGMLPNLAGYFQGWDKDFRADAVERSWQRGMLPMLTWESRPSSAANNQLVEADYSLPLILGDPQAGEPGRYDEYVRRYARDVAELGLPVAIRLNHEMNGDWYPWSEMTKEGDPINGNRPGDYAAVWQHVHDIFEAEGANEHVIWVWAPNIVNNLPDTLTEPGDLEGLYPGDDYVDWVGLSGYYRPPYRDDQTPTFEYSYDRTLEALRDLTDKPILLAEVGASEIGDRKSQWVESFFDGLRRTENDDVIGFAWFHLTVTSTVRGERVTNDWRVDSSWDSLAAFAEGLKDPTVRMGGSSYPEPDGGTPEGGTASASDDGAGDDGAGDEGARDEPAEDAGETEDEPAPELDAVD